MRNSILIFFFFMRFSLLVYCCFISFSFPHVWRQSDTLGIAARYFSRFVFEKSPTSFWLNLVPAALNSSDYYGYVATEFPLINLLTSPAFIFGVPRGQIIARLILLIILGFCIFVLAKWRKVKFPNGVSFGEVALLFPLVTLGGIYFGKFVPDPLATILVLLAVVASWEKSRPLISFFAASFGLLIKPTSIVVFGLLLFRPVKIVRKIPLWSLISLCVCAAYYLGAIPQMLKIQDAPFAFQVVPKQPIDTLVEFLSEFNRVQTVFGRYLFSQVALGMMCLGYCFLWRSFSKAHWGLWVLLIVQFLLVGILDGVHSFQHTYYFIGLQPTVLLILGEFLSVSRAEKHKGKIQKVVYYGLIGVLLVNILKYSGHDLQLIEPNPAYAQKYQFSCSKLKARNPDLPWNRGYVFRSPREPFPELGLCFGERSVSMKSQFGFYPFGFAYPKECAEIDRENSVVLVKCS